MGRTARLGLAIAFALAGCGGSSRRVAAGHQVGGASSTTVGESPTSDLVPPTSESPTTGVAPTVSAPPVTASPTTATPPPPSTSAAPAPTAVPGTAPTGSAPGAYGLVTAGPTCPVQRQGQTCPPSPVSGARVDAQAGDGHVVASTRTSSNGGYSMLLAPGGYTLVVTTGSTYPRCPATSVTVASGAATRADVSCDSGIR